MAAAYFKRSGGKRVELEKTGRFIAELRKEKGLTQKDLGLLLHITDKAISKWECGCNLPDHDVMVNLCNELGITVNELLSGEKISSEDYNKKAEENMMKLVNENEENRKSNIWQRMISIGICLILAWLTGVVIYKATAERLNIRHFVDLIGLQVDIVLPILMLILTRQFKAFMNLFKYNLIPCSDAGLIEKSKKAGTFGIKAVLLSGGICSFIYFVQWLEHANNAGYFGPNLANIVIGIFYSFIISAVILVLKERI